MVVVSLVDVPNYDTAGGGVQNCAREVGKELSAIHSRTTCSTQNVCGVLCCVVEVMMSKLFLSLPLLLCRVVVAAEGHSSTPLGPLGFAQRRCPLACTPSDPTICASGWTPASP